MDATTRRTLTRDPARDPTIDPARDLAPGPGAEAVHDATDALDTAPASRRRPRMPERRVNAVLLVIAVLATIAGVALLLLNDSGSSDTPAVDAPAAAESGGAATSPVSTPADTPAPVPASERPVLGIGSAGPDVVALQERLVALGFDPGAVDGQFGPGTATAVEAFQASVGIAADGVVGTETWAALDAAEPSPA